MATERTEKIVSNLLDEIDNEYKGRPGFGVRFNLATKDCNPYDCDDVTFENNEPIHLYKQEGYVADIVYKGKTIGGIKEWSNTGLLSPVLVSFRLFPKGHKYDNNVHFREDETDMLEFATISSMLEMYNSDPDYFEI